MIIICVYRLARLAQQRLLVRNEDRNKLVNKISRDNAFTLIELLIVIVIIGILASASLLRYGPVIENARSAEAYTVLAEIAAAESSYYVDNNAYTFTWSDLDRYDSAPASENFTYTLDPSYYGKATPKSGKGSVTYYMCFNGSNKGTSALSCPSST